MANDIKLQESHPVDSNLRPVKIGGKSTSLELADTDNGARVRGDLEATGTIKVSDDIKLSEGKALYLDGGGDTKIYAADDSIYINVGGDVMAHLTEGGDDGNLFYFKSAVVGFLTVTETFSDDSIIGSGGTDDTHIDFRHSNKAKLAVTGDITNLNLIFPGGSGNLTLLLTYDGDHDITNYKVYKEDESAATGTDVLWAGGSAPATTSGGVDILSFFWDRIPQKAYGVGSLNFS